MLDSVLCCVRMCVKSDDAVTSLVREYIPPPPAFSTFRVQPTSLWKKWSDNIFPSQAIHYDNDIDESLWCFCSLELRLHGAASAWAPATQLDFDAVLAAAASL